MDGTSTHLYLLHYTSLAVNAHICDALSILSNPYSISHTIDDMHETLKQESTAVGYITISHEVVFVLGFNMQKAAD